MSEESGHQLAPASPTVPGQLIDAHVHLFTHGLFQEYVKAHPDANPVFRQAVKDRRFGRQQALLPDMTPEQTAHWYVERLKAAGVAKALLVSVVPDSQWRLAYQCENVCVDSSGTNNWLDYHVPPMSLTDVDAIMRGNAARIFCLDE
ncbi:MAG: hypothetical protein KGZ89_04955 [Actinobacteria bacterium]|nr:hypothetical protein [Actinomycetota bacterium]